MSDYLKRRYFRRLCRILEDDVGGMAYAATVQAMVRRRFVGVVARFGIGREWCNGLKGWKTYRQYVIDAGQVCSCLGKGA